jgi:hypothetical protein
LVLSELAFSYGLAFVPSPSAEVVNLPPQLLDNSDESGDFHRPAKFTTLLDDFDRFTPSCSSPLPTSEFVRMGLLPATS